MSNVGTALGLIVLGIYMMLKSWGLHVELFNWIPLVSFSWTTFISLLGVQSLTITVIAEIMPEKIKEFGVTLCMMLLWLLLFFNFKFQPTLIEWIGFHWSIFIFASVCIFGASFTLAYIPETKGKSHAEIMKSLE